jgi:signal transduction histidine kinase
LALDFDTFCEQKDKIIEMTSRRIKKERQQTDQGLQKERSKTDVEISKHLDVSRSTNDIKKESSRRKMDKSLAQSRAAENQNINKIRSHRGSKKDWNKIDRILASSRHLTDKQTRQSRAEADKNQAQERQEESTTTAALLQKERLLTDNCLGVERSKTDQFFTFDSQRLIYEKKAHTSTKSKVISRDEYLAIISHDLKNALGVISLGADSILESNLKSEQDQNDLREVAEIIKRNTEVLIKMTTSLVEVQKMQLGKINLSLASHDISQLVKETTIAFAPSAQQKDIALEVILPKKRVKIQCDALRIYQVLSNLLSNAIKFNSPHRPISVKLEDLPGKACISVKDSGPGISATEKKHLFKRFSQLHPNQKTGTGLGLYISKCIVKAHQGNIGVSSAPGAGSTFYFIIPKTTT